MITCEYCHVIAKDFPKITSCAKCGAPLRQPEETATVRQKLTSLFSLTPAWAEGIDVSKWQGTMNWDTAKPKIDYAIIKASEYNWEDSQYTQNINGCDSRGIVHGVYHFCRPEYSWLDQANFFADRISGDIPPVADIERTGSLSKTALAEWILSFVSQVQSRTGGAVMIYTRASFWNAYVARVSWAKDLPLWVAHYNAYISQPAIPYDWDTWALWQWSADGNGLGSEYGAESKSIDLNRFNGDSNAFFDWVNVQPPIPPDPTQCTQYRVGVAVLNVRSGPGVNYPIIDKLYSGDVVLAEDINGDNVWVQIADNKWCAHTYNGANYLKKVT